MHCYLGKREGSENWYIYQYDERTGQCPRFSTRTTDRESAEKKLAEHIIKLPHRQILSDATLVKVMLRYWEHHGQHIFARDTVRRVMGLVAEHEPMTRVYEWPIPKQKEFAFKLAKTDSTRRRYMGVVRAALQWAADGGEIPTMPAVYKVQATDAEGVRPFSLDELKALCEGCRNEHERRFMLLMLSTAPRPGATLDLTWDRINVETGVVNYVKPGRRLTKKRRAKSPLCAPALAYFNERRSVGPVIQWNGRALKGHKMTFKRIAERAKVSGTAYGVRKAVSIWLRQQAVHEWDIKGMLGHAIGGETERYAHYRPEYMRAAASAVERLLVEIRPSWLASYLPVPVESVPRETQVAVVNGNFGARDRDRTCDPYHVKALHLEDFQILKSANDD
jgi:integrase